MNTSRINKTYINLVKNSAITIGLAAGILSVTPQLKLQSGRTSAQTQPPPNVVVIMVDDLSKGELNVVLNKGWMPNLKTYLINNGTNFTQSFVTNSLCCPSRSTFLTGQYSHNHGVLNNNAPTGGVTKLQDKSTLATWLKRAGYKTCLIGKYLNGYGENLIADTPSDNPTYIPPGWDDWQALVAGGNNQYNYIINNNGTLVNYGANPTTPPDEYLTDVLAQRSVNFINKSETSSDRTPFFLYITPTAPHFQNGGNGYTIKPAPRHQGTASTISLPKPPSFNEQDVSDKPAWLRNNFPLLSSQKIATIQAGYRSRLESLRAIDDLIGSVVSALIKNGELNNTVLMFTSDNGYLFGQHRLTSKTHAYEQSIRVPLYIRAPGFSASSSSRLVINNDLAPTIAQFAGATPDITIDGRSLIPLLRNPNLTNWRKQFLIQNLALNQKLHSPAYFAIRTRSSDASTSQLYVNYSTGNKEFYDLRIDPDQVQSLHNQADRQQQIQTLQNKLTNLKVCAGQSCRTLEDN